MLLRLIAAGLFAASTLLLSGNGYAVSSLRIMTFNVWTAEDTVAGRNKLRDIIATVDADIVGLQEMTDSAGRSIASALGMHYFQQSGGDIQVLSRYPIVGSATGNLGVQIELSPGQEIWFFNSHMSAYPYQPYDLRDGTLPMIESAVIAAANAARGGEVTSYLNSMNAAINSQLPTFLVGDFNEPSHLDWTSATAASTPRPFDLKVEYPASKRIVDAGLVDSLRTVRPDPVSDHAYSWTPGAPYPNLDADEVMDRIDILYHRGIGVVPTNAFTVGPQDGSPDTDLGIVGYNADHRAMVVDYSISPFSSIADLNADGELSASDWAIFRTYQFSDLSNLNSQQAWERGDLNADFRNDHADFVIFKSVYESTNGPGSFTNMLTVPEPASWVLVSLISIIIAQRQRT